MDLKISDMIQLQQGLHDRHAGKWEPLTPEFGKDSMLYMVEELGEAIAVIKKKGSSAIISEPSVRAAFVEEMADVLMYYTDTLIRYGVTADELSNAYQRKHDRNMGRDYIGEYKEKYHG